MDNKDIKRLHKGLHTDNSEKDQPKGTYRFALNAINETEQGDLGFLSNEESNEPCGSLTPGYIPLNETYIGDGNTLIFSVAGDESASEIGIKDKECSYVVIVNDTNAPESQKLNFKITHQIDSTFRLRRGCERTVYFVDDYNKPRFFNVDREEDFQDSNGDWDSDKFELIRSYDSIPKFEDINVINSGGALEAGSYNIAIQYVDVNLNPTEWITTSETILIYNDSTTENFLDIKGSINVATGQDFEDYRDFPTTTKSIKVIIGDLDTSFLFYRLAFIEATTGSGQVTKVRYTQYIPTAKNFFTYTGVNFETEGTEEEVQAINSVITSASSIEQVENRLILGNTKGSKVDFCKLQKYASKIKADVTIKKVISNVLYDPESKSFIEGNTKSPTLNFEAVGYMSGEIYSFGIVYIFEDGTQSPVYHIPGKNKSSENKTFSLDNPEGNENVHAMSVNNTSVSNTYIDNSNCSSKDYWGVDSEGDSLKGEFVRHHRFPSRKDINASLVKEEGSIGGIDESFYQISIDIAGNVSLPCTQEQIDAGECGALQDGPEFQARIVYKVDGGVDQEIIININPTDQSVPVQINELSNLLTSPNVEIQSIEESVLGVPETLFNTPTTIIVGATQVITGPSSSAGASSPTPVNNLVYTISLKPYSFNTETKVYSTDVLGIRFSGVDLPDTEDTEGEKIVGYYIVRNERTEDEKTILDSAILTPSLNDGKYISHGILCPEFKASDTAASITSKRVFGMIHPEHKFKNREYNKFDEISHEGTFEVVQKNKSVFRHLDVTKGTSFNSRIHKDGGPHNDQDGWSLKVISRDNILRYNGVAEGFDFIQDDIQDVFYLDALHSRDIEDNSLSVYNIAGDNKVGIVQLKEDLDTCIFRQEDDTSTTGILPYVHLKRNISDSYSTFRSLPYYKTSVNIHKFHNEDGSLNTDSSSTSEFNGDSYVSPMRYVNTVWWDNKLAKRVGKSSLWNRIIGALLLVVAVVIAIVSYGSATGLSVVIVGSGLALIGGAALFISSGVKKDALVKAYYQEYDKGLRRTALDEWVSLEYKYARYNSVVSNLDDEIQWIGDSCTDLWFESQINTSLRYGMTSRPSTFMNAPGKIEKGREEPERDKEFHKTNFLRDDPITPFTILDIHLSEKLSIFNPDFSDSREYIGHPLGEYYEINPDFERRNKQKTFFHLPIEYDCCSDCQEEFPHRIHYSEQSFQEELSDNFKTFLPNNYRDIEGETGKITDLFKIKNNLYVHTEEALWHLPQNYQERVTGDIVSFIGTGSYFSMPPRKILDGNKNSGGTRHKWATLQTIHGVFFVSEADKKVYLFDGNQLKALNLIGNDNWFKKNLGINLLKDYYSTTGENYKYDNNPSNPYGVGFISTYDSAKERFILTKKDGLFSDEFTSNSDYEICLKNGELTVFPNYQQTVEDREEDGWTYEGIDEDCRMKFTKQEISTTTVQRREKQYLSSDELILFTVDWSDTFTQQNLVEISDAITGWQHEYKNNNPSWAAGNMGRAFLNIDPTYPVPVPGSPQIDYGDPNYSEEWINALHHYSQLELVPGEILGRPLNEISVTLITIVGENGAPISAYHTHALETTLPSFEEVQVGQSSDFLTIFTDHRENFKTVYNQLKGFRGILYPILRERGTGDDNLTNKGQAFLQHALSSLKSVPYTNAETGAIVTNPAFTAAEWTILRNSLEGSAPYSESLEDYGWTVVTNRSTNGVDPVLTTEQLNVDLEEFFLNTEDLLEEEIQVSQTISDYVEGTVIQQPFTKADNSWTMSYSLKNDSWVSWHSYLPNFYYHLNGKFYSWQHGNDNMWRHNVKGSFQNFYGNNNPFIVEYVSMSEPIHTKIYDTIQLHTEAKRFDTSTQQYVSERFKTFNKGIFYNSRQCTGLLNFQVKDTSIDPDNYMLQQVVSLNPGTVMIDKNEEDWYINDIRDIRVDYTQSIFTSNTLSVQSEYYIDKILNNSSLDYNKDWRQLESFRDKYLVIRLIFDNFEDVKLIMNYSVGDEQKSFR